VLQIKNVNDRETHANELGALLSGKDVIVNLIPYNPTDVVVEYETPDEADVLAFSRIVQSYGLLSTVWKLPSYTKVTFVKRGH
jgi:23S rRNA (adenine2503-C2)-methyltransferase